MSSSNLDVLVAGGGPAGATAALLLARAGKRVCVVERSLFPRTKACGEYLNAGSVRALHELGVGVRLDGLSRAVRGVRLHGHGIDAQIDFPKPGWSTTRAALDETLLRAAVDAGAQVVHARVEDCADSENSAALSVRFPDGSTETLRADAVVGADGIASVVARKCGSAGAPAVNRRFALGGHYAGFAPLDEYVDMFVDGTTYVAINPLGPTRANVMLVVNECELATHREDVDAFAEQRARELAGAILDGARLESKRLAIGPLSNRAARLAGKRTLLAGDAACFVDPFTGQGVLLALRCARIAAECIVAGEIGAYEARARREIAARDRAARSVAQLIGSPVLARIGALLLRRGPGMLQPLIRSVTGAA